MGEWHWVIICLVVGMLIKLLIDAYGELGKLPHTVSFYPNFLTVVSLNGKHIQTFFYGDVTAAKVVSMGSEVEISAKASAHYKVPSKEGKPRILTIQGDVKVRITCEDGEKKKVFLEKVA